MTFLIRHPSTALTERSYIHETIFTDFLGVEWRGLSEERDDVCIEIQGEQSARRLLIADNFLRLAHETWLSPSTLAKQPLSRWDSIPPPLRASETPLPVVFGRPGCRVTRSEIALDIDILGSCFYLLSRYEEAVRPERDVHDRFPAAASLAVQEHFLDRPLVDEYVELLWSCMLALWPRLERKARSFRIIVTCDVDRPLTPWARTGRATARKIAGDLIKARDLKLAGRSLRLHMDHRAERYERDPFMTFDWFLDQCEQAGHRATFNFICAHSNPRYDGSYHLSEPVISQLMTTIHKRGHEIGLHASYGSYLDGKQVTHEATLLRTRLAELGIDQSTIGTRQHYLRWRTPDTSRLLDRAQLAYDSTLGFAEQPGFRCGTCFEYALYDVRERRVLSLRERPLILMEASVLSSTYMGLGHTPDALQLMETLKRTCKRFNGNFVLLWHNSELHTERDREFFRTLIS